VVSSVPGIQASDTTGGVQGSYQQAGTGDFGRVFGGEPAEWFRGGPRAELARERSNVGRDLLGRVEAGGGVGGSTSVNPVAPSLGEVGGGENDEEFQRVLQEVMRQRFNEGGR
jgi:hypothetical protein